MWMRGLNPLFIDHPVLPPNPDPTVPLFNGQSIGNPKYLVLWPWRWSPGQYNIYELQILCIECAKNSILLSRGGDILRSEHFKR